VHFHTRRSDLRQSGEEIVIRFGDARDAWRRDEEAEVVRGGFERRPADEMLGVRGLVPDNGGRFRSDIDAFAGEWRNPARGRWRRDRDQNQEQ
jgi:hypothetical protein